MLEAPQIDGSHDRGGTGREEQFIVPVVGIRRSSPRVLNFPLEVHQIARRGGGRRDNLRHRQVRQLLADCDRRPGRDVVRCVALINCAVRLMRSRRIGLDEDVIRA